MQKRIGHKAGSGSQRKPVVAPDSASSKSYANIVYGISEGEIVGLANGMKSVILDGTPVESLSGSINIPNLDFQFRSGTNDQEHLTGFPSVSNEIGYNNVELKAGTPFVHYINDLNVDAARVRFTWGKIFQQNESNGDTKGFRIEYAIDVQTDGNGFVEVLKTALDDKTSSGYERSHRIELPRAEIGWELRIRRITANSTSEYIGDKMYLSAVTEVLDAKLRYPNTALIGLKFDADYFGNIPKVDFRLKGKIIKVPANYNPETRTYATSGVGTTNGVWDGSFKLAYTNNPAWVFYDIILNRRYGLGDRLDPSMVDKWSLYSIAKYCDVMVPDGEGGMEPRLTCNVYINNEYEAFTLLMQLASTFRGLIHWNGNAIVVDTDRPTEPVFTYTRANIKGEFNYSGTRARDRHSMFTVSFDDPRNDYKTDQEVVSSTLAISEIGVRNKDLSAFGCTSRGQAQRIGQWALLKEQEETRTVTFEVGLDGFIPITGKIIEISDPLLAGRATGGRISVVSSDLKTITVDRDVEIKTGDRFVVNTNSGTQESREVLSVNGRDITVTAAFTDTSAENVWAVESDDLQLMRFRVLSVAQTNGDGGIVGFTVSAVQHNPDLQDSADFSSYIERPNYSVIDIHTQEQVTGLVLSSENVINQGIDITNLVIEWKQAPNAVKYELEWRKDNGQWIKTPLIYSNTYTVEDIYHGTYEARIVAINAMDVRSLYTIASPIAVDSKFSEPPVLASLSVVGKLFGIEVTWRFPAVGALNTAYTELQVSYLASHTDEKLLGTYAYPMDRMELNGLHGNLQVWIKARLVDRNGIEGQWTPWMTGTTTNSADEILDLLDGRITSTELDQGLRDNIATGVAAGAIANEAKTLADESKTLADEAKDAAASAQTTANTAKTTANSANTAATNAQNAASSAQAAATTATTNANAAKATADQAKADVSALNTSLNQTRTELEGRLDTAEDGLSQEILDRTAGDSAVVSQLNTYKTSNDAAVSAVQTKAESALSQSGANATTITNLTATVNTKNRTYQQTTAPTANLVVGDLWINTTSGKNNETKRWNGSTWVITTDPRIASTASALATLTTTVNTLDGKTTTNSSDIVSLRNDLTTTNNTVSQKADSSALTALNSTVTQQGNAITSQGTRVTNLENSVNHATTGLATKASTTALNTLDGKVTTIDGKTTANTNGITSLSGRMTTVEGTVATKADASALNNIYTKTETDTKAAEIAAGKIDEFNANLVIGGVNQLINSDGERTASPREYLLYESSDYLKDFYDNNLGKDVTVSFDLKTTVAGTVQVYCHNNTHHHFTATVNVDAADVNEWVRYAVTVKPLKKVGGEAATQSGLEFYGTYDTGRFPSVRKVQLEAGNKATDWSPSPRDTQAALDANASAIETTSTNVSNINGTVVSQGSRLTSLENTVNHATTGLATKASSSALNTLDSKVTTVNGKVTTNAANITTLQGKVTTVENGLATKADASALNNIYTKTQTDAALAGQVTAFDAKLRTLPTQGENLIPNGTFDPNLPSYGFTGVASDSAGVPAGCPFPYVTRLAVRDHFLDVNKTTNIPCKAGDVYEISVLVACTTGTAHFNLYTYRRNSATASSNLVATQIGRVTAAEGTTWKRLTARWTVPAHTTHQFFVPFLQIDQNSPWGTVWYATDWSCVNVTAGAKAQDVADATATAVTNTNAEVTRINDVVVSQGTSITNLQAGLTTANNNIALKADGSALTALTTRVTTAEGNITSQGSRVTSLENSVNHATTGLATKASSAALNTLDNKVTAIDGRVTSNSSSITSLNNSLTTTNTNVTAAQTAATNAMTAAGQKGKVIFGTTAPSTEDRLPQNLWIDATGNANTPKRWTGSAWVAVTDKVATDAAAAAAAAQATANTKADAAALTSLTTRVTTAEGTITSQGNRVTSLENSVNNATTGLASKASSSALTTLNNQVQHSTTGLSAVNSKVDSLKATVENPTSGLASKASSSALDTLSNKVNHSTTGLDAIASKTTVLESDVSKALEAVTVSDTRATNQPPSWYLANYPRRVVNEFKTQTAIGVGGFFGGTYCNLETKVYYTDLTGGDIIQTATSSADPSLYVQRKSNGTAAWTAWVQPIKDLRDDLEGKAAASALTELTTRVSTAEGTISAEASKLSTLSTTVGNHTSSISSQQTSINGLNAKATLTVAAGNTVGGVALGNNGGTVNFIVRANTFAIAPPVSANAGNTGKYAFTYQSTSVTLPNGTVVPAGLYLDQAVIGQISASKINASSLSAISANLGTIQVDTANIKNLAVTTLKIQDEAVTVPSGIYNSTPIVTTFSYNNGSAPNNVDQLYGTHEVLVFNVATHGGKLRVDATVAYDSLITINSYPANRSITSVLVMVVEVLVNGSVAFKQEIYPVANVQQTIRFTGVSPTPVLIYPSTSGTLEIKLRVSYSPKYTGVFFSATSANNTSSKITARSLACMELKK